MLLLRNVNVLILAFQNCFHVPLFLNNGSFKTHKLVEVHFILFLDLLAVPKHPYAAMENWGLNVFVEQRILLDSSISSISYLLDVTMVIVHELCHQVGDKQYLEYFINEIHFKYFPRFLIWTNSDEIKLSTFKSCLFLDIYLRFI